MRDVAVGHDLAAVERIREISQARAEDDADPGTDPALRPHVLRRRVDTCLQLTRHFVPVVSTAPRSGSSPVPVRPPRFPAASSSSLHLEPPRPAGGRRPALPPPARTPPGSPFPPPAPRSPRASAC